VYCRILLPSFFFFLECLFAGIIFCLHCPM
jgi:hypothetical protein